MSRVHEGVRAPGTGQAVGEALYLKLRPHDEPAEGVLVAWGVTLEGRKVLLGLQLGSRESYDNWLAFGRDLAGRGLRAPAMVVADGARAVEDRTRAVADGRGAALHGALCRPARYADVGITGTGSATSAICCRSVTATRSAAGCAPRGR
jgi:hypothetical protein